MDEDEYGALFLVSVDELGVPGLWASVKDVSRAAGGDGWGRESEGLRKGGNSKGKRMGRAHGGSLAMNNQFAARGRRQTKAVDTERRDDLPRSAHTTNCCPPPALQLLESRCVLHGLTLHNKMGRAVAVDRLQLQ